MKDGQIQKNFSLILTSSLISARVPVTCKMFLTDNMIRCNWKLLTSNEMAQRHLRLGGPPRVQSGLGTLGLQRC